MGGSRNMPIVFRSPIGWGVHTPELHSDNLEGLVAQSQGLKVVILQIHTMQRIINLSYSLTTIQLFT